MNDQFQKPCQHLKWFPNLIIETDEAKPFNKMIL